MVLGSVVVLTTLTNITSLGIIIGLSVAVFFGGKFLRNLEKPKRWQALFIGVLILLFVLKNYKIADFDLLQRIGLSYILFRLIHFLIESANKNIHTYDLGSFINYIIFFPTFIAGPIDGYNNFDYWAGSTRKSYDQVLFKTGLFKIFVGIIKKFLLVPIIAVYASDFALFDVHYTWQVAFIFSMFLYSFYILLDFSGYSDIAIGTAYLIGVKTPENFDNPYGANNLSTFWKKWHMTFSNFLLKYVFKPTVINFSKWFPSAPRLTISFIGYVVTFTICGIWHGPTLNFLYWGLWHGVFLYLYKLWDVYVLGKKAKNFSDSKKKVVNAAGLVFTFLVVTTGWVFFNYQTIDLGIIGRNLLHSDSSEIRVSTILNGKEPVLKVDLSNGSFKNLDSLEIILVGGNSNNPQVFSHLNSLNSENHYIIPVKPGKSLYEIQVKGVKNQKTVSQKKVAYLFSNSFEPTKLQEKLFGTNVQSKKEKIDPSTLKVSKLFLTQEMEKEMELETRYFDNYGWIIQVNYAPHSSYNVWVEIRKKGSDNWRIAKKNRAGHYGFYHINGTSEFNGNYYNFDPGMYEVRLKYVANSNTSEWIYATTEMHDYVNN